MSMSTIVTDEHGLQLVVWRIIDGNGSVKSDAGGWLPVLPAGSVMTINGKQYVVTRHSMDIDNNNAMLIIHVTAELS